MANILLTDHCNRRCSFCFARSRVNIRKQEADYKSNMPFENVVKIMDFLSVSGDCQLRLLGGEPTLHPQFEEIVEVAVKRKFHVHVFSNGMMKNGIADFLARQPEDSVSLLCNISDQADDSARKIEKRDNALLKLGKRVRLGITVTNPDFEYRYIIDHILKFGLTKGIRLGIAQPIVGYDNEYLPTSCYKDAGKKIMEMVKECIRHEIIVGFDCGLTLCMFDENEIGTLMKLSGGFVMHCSPVIDIGQNLDVWHCFPLAEVMNTRLNQFKNRNEIVSFYRKTYEPYRSLGAMPECIRCIHLKRGQCTGGCLAHTLNALNSLPPKYAPEPQ